jgi:hypothetical protein
MLDNSGWIFLFKYNVYCEYIVSNMAGATGGVGIAYPCGAPEFTPRFFVGFMLLNC